MNEETKNAITGNVAAVFITENSNFDSNELHTVELHIANVETSCSAYSAIIFDARPDVIAIEFFDVPEITDNKQSRNISEKQYEIIKRDFYINSIARN